MLLLAFDTATPAVTVALHDGSRVLAERTSIDGRRHGELLAPHILSVLADAGAVSADVTDVAVGVGPGPFTSLRVGLVTALAFASVRGLPVHGVCSLDVLARDVEVNGSFLVATDARRREIYWAVYDEKGRRTSGPGVARAVDLPEGVRALPAAGVGPELFPDQIPRTAGPRYPRASALASAVVETLGGTGVELLPPRPLYLRRPDATEPGRPKAVLK